MKNKQSRVDTDKDKNGGGRNGYGNKRQRKSIGQSRINNPEVTRTRKNMGDEMAMAINVRVNQKGNQE